MTALDRKAAIQRRSVIGSHVPSADNTKTLFSDRSQACFWVSKSELAENKYDLSINRYKETVHIEEQYDSPKEILEQWMGLVDEIQGELKELQLMLPVVD